MKSLFENILEGPVDPVLGTAIAYKEDPYPQKVNLGVGAYRTEDGKPYVFPVVEKVQNALCAKNLDKEYLPIDGMPELKQPTQKLLFTDKSDSFLKKRIATAQVLSGSGGLRVAAEFIATQLPLSKTIYVSEPTWINHYPIFSSAGLNIEVYQYWDAPTKKINMDGMLESLKNAPKYSSILLHTCAHNPTGMDPTPSQWKCILKLVQEKKFLVIFDTAYQGYATGDLDKDAAPIRLFEEAGLEFFTVQSFAKNMGLYGERIGMLHVVCHTAERANVVLTQLKPIIRRMYSSPPLWGARIVSEILTSPENLNAWKDQLKEVALRIQEVQTRLRDGLKKKGTPGDWNHITEQIGMFSFTGLTPDQCDRMISHWHIYMLRSGRISLAGLNSANLQYVVDAIDDCVRCCGTSKL